MDPIFYVLCAIIVGVEIYLFATFIQANTTRMLLSVMMFLQFFLWGSWYVTAPNFLTTIGFTGGDIGWTYTVGPIAGIISPFFVGMIADRFFPTQRVLGAMHLIGAGLMYVASSQMGSASPSTINAIFFGYMLTFFPTLALTNTLAMRNLTNSETEFPSIRVQGTMGWIAGNLVMTFTGFEKTIDQFGVATGIALVLGLFSFLLLPSTPPTATGKISTREILGLDALAMLKNKSYFVFLLCSTLICIPLAYYYQITSRLVEMVELPIGQTMSYGQMSEIFFMLVMPLLFARLGVKKMLAIGMLAWVVRYGLFSVGGASQVSVAVIIGIILHGICYDFFFVTGQIYTDQAAPPHLRGQAQGLLVLFTLGIGMAIGAQVAGWRETHYTPTQQFADKLEGLRAMDWKPLWMEPAMFAAAVLLIFLILFREPARSGKTPELPTDVPTGEIV